MSDCLYPSPQKGRTYDGYWQVWPKTHGGYHRLHRYIYAKHHGVELTSKDIVRHLCNDPSCIEISHLMVGSVEDNICDSLDMGTHNLLRQNRS